MSWNPILDPDIPIGDAVDAIEAIIVPRARDIGAFEVRRALPSARRKMVGPFIFFDQMGPAEFLSGQTIDIRPHPHIGLSTVTYLMQGEMHHRDSLGTDQWITPGAVNLMNAGHGIIHSERTDEHLTQQPYALFGIQSWLALPKDHEDRSPVFEHSPKESLPLLAAEGKTVRVILGEAYGAKSDVATTSETLYLDVALDARAKLPLPENHEDRAVYILQGSVTVAGDQFEAGRMLVFRPTDPITVVAGDAGARVLVLGGATMDGDRHIWWNFVASSKERIEAAKEAWRAGDWQNGRFQLPPGDNAEFIPLPE